MSATAISGKILVCAAILVAATMQGCDDLKINTPASTASATNTLRDKLVTAPNVLHIKEIVKYERGLPDDGPYKLAGQIAYMVTPVPGSGGGLADVDLLVELELRPSTGEERGWKIGGMSVDRLNVNRPGEPTLHKSYIIDETDKTRKLNLLFGIDQTQLVVKQLWISQSVSDLD